MKVTNIQNNIRGFISRVAVLAVLLFCPIDVYTQTPDFTWIKQAGGTGLDRAYSIAIDRSGNSLITGYFYQYPATFDTITLTSSGSYDIFTAKYDTSGKVLWAKQAGGPSWDSGYSIATDETGNSVITGVFQDTASFGPITLTSAAKGDIFIAKYDASGNVIWARRAGGTGHDEGHGIAVDGWGNIIVTGFFEGTANFDTDTLTTDGGRDIFIAKYDAEGNVVWTKRAGGNNWDSGLSIAVDKSDHSIISGYFRGTANFGSITLTSTGKYDIFIAKYNAMGNVLWAKQAGGEGDDFGNGVATDGSGNSIVTGYFNDIAFFGTIMLTSAGGSDIFISKYDASGNVLWSKQAGGTGDDEGYGITANRYGNSPIIGYFHETASFDTIMLTNAGYKDIFMANYDPSGNVLWAIGSGGTGYDEGYGIATNGLGNSIVTGYFDGTATFGSKTLISIGGPDIFIANFGKGWQITGRISHYSNNEPVDSALVKVNGIYSDTTDLSGNYELSNVPVGNYVIQAEKKNDLTNAITGADALLVLQYLAFLKNLTDDQKTAADVTGDGKVTGSDALAMLRYLAFFTTNIGHTGEWTFRPQQITITNLNQDMVDQNFKGYVLGDPTGDWSGGGVVALAKSTQNQVTQKACADLSFGELKVQSQKKLVVPIMLESPIEAINTLVFTVDYDSSMLVYKSSQLTTLTQGFTAVDNCTQKGKVHFAIAGVNGISESGAVISMMFELKQGAEQSSTELSYTGASINDVPAIALNSVRIDFENLRLGIPKIFDLSQNYPNPFNSKTVIKYQLPEAGRLELKIYNTLGQEVRTLVDEEKEAGYYELRWDGKDDQGQSLPSGLYFYRIQTGGFQGVKKLLLIK